MYRKTCGWLALGVLTACGGGGGTPTQPPPPPPPPSTLPGPPATVTVSAGDNQTGEPGKALTTKPVVLVKDAQGRATPGIAVAFAIDAGAGSVETPNATTATDGSASPGNWTLGAVAGANRLKVTVGSLAPVTLTATGAFPLVQISDQVVGAGGGVITVTKPGDPLNGTTLTIPNGAYAGSAEWKVSSEAIQAAPTIPGVRIIAPPLTIQTDAGYAAKPLTLRIPVTLPADSFATVFFYRPSTGKYEVLPVVASDAQSITVATRHFSGQFQALRTPLGGMASAIGGPDDPALLKILLGAQSATLLNQGPISGLYQGPFDDWEFPQYGSYITPDGHLSGFALSTLYYWRNIYVGQNAPRLFGRYDKGPFWADNDLGYRIAALAEGDAAWPAVRGIIDGMSPPPAPPQLFGVATALFVTHEPQLVALSGPAGTVLMLAVTASLQGMTLADPNNPGSTVTMPFSNGSFQPVQVALIAGGPLVTFTSLRFIGSSAMINLAPLGARFTTLPNGPVGTTEFPGHQLQYFDEDLQQWTNLPASTTTLTLSWSSIQMRAFCAACERTIPGTSNLTALDIYNGTAQQLATDRTAGQVTFTVPAGTGRIGVHILGGRASSGSTLWRHLDFRYVTINATSFFITPNPGNTQVGASLTLTAKNQAQSATHYKYDWDFGDGQVLSVNSDSTVSHIWLSSGTFPVKVTIKDLTTGVTVGRATGTVAVDVPVPIWRLNTWVAGPVQNAVAQNSFDLTALSADGNLYDALLGIPSKATIFYVDQPTTIGAKTFGIGVHFLVANNPPGPTGLDPAIPSRVLAQPPASAGFPTGLDVLLTSGDLDSGTLNGLAVTNYVNDRTSCAAPSHFVAWINWEIQANKNGKTLSGKVKRTQRMLKQVGFDPACGAFLGFLGTTLVQEWNFTATRLK